MATRMRSPSSIRRCATTACPTRSPRRRSGFMGGHGTFKPGGDNRRGMGASLGPARARRSGGARARWRRALALSVGLHALVLAAVGFSVRAQDPIAGAGSAAASADSLLTVAEAPPTFVDLQPAELGALPAPSAAVAAPPEPATAAAVEADARHVAREPAGAPLGTAAERRAPAPDQGDGPGLAAATPAWRR